MAAKKAAQLIDIPVRMHADSVRVIKSMADQCGLTVDQMASALFIMAWPKFASVPAKAPPKKKAPK